VRVFVSSTLGELAPERVAARAAIEGLHLTPVLFELGARPHPPRALYAAYMDQSDVFIGIYWQRYGWVAPGAAVSGLEDEYELSARLPRLLYVKEPAPDRDADLVKLLARFQTEGGVSYRKFTGPDELARLIADDLAVLLSERFGAARSPGSPRLHRPRVPVPLTPTIGRRKEIAAVTALLRRGARLVTITGPGGVGKSRLAVMAALELAAEDRGQVYFIQLTSLADPRHLIATVAEHVGARLDTSAPLDDLADRLGERHTLLVLDNFEHLAAAAADLIGLLDRCAALQVLVTSRHVLRLRGEHEFILAPLDVPSPAAANIRKASAVTLFVDRAVAARPGFALTAENERSVAELCRRLDGLPLALELAAARLRLLEPGELLDRIGTRLDLLAAGAADLPERQRALRATLDWSHNLLTPTERTLFARLSVFAGGASLAAAEAVCGGGELPDVLEVMASLLEKSLLVHVTPAAGPARFQMLHVVRAYAWERLADRGEVEALRARHAQWLLDAVRQDEGAASGDDRWDVLDAEIDNIRSVLTWALEQTDLAAAATLARELRPWWWIRGMVWEALEWLERAAAQAAQRRPRRRTRRGSRLRSATCKNRPDVATRRTLVFEPLCSCSPHMTKARVSWLPVLHLLRCSPTRAAGPTRSPWREKSSSKHAGTSAMTSSSGLRASSARFWSRPVSSTPPAPPTSRRGMRRRAWGRGCTWRWPTISSRPSSCWPASRKNAGGIWGSPRRSTAAPRTWRASATRWRSRRRPVSPTTTSTRRPTRRPSRRNCTTHSGWPYGQCCAHCTTGCWPNYTRRRPGTSTGRPRHPPTQPSPSSASVSTTEPERLIQKTAPEQAVLCRSVRTMLPAAVSAESAI
jgi:predicted ATPase